jgi:hypothetical protein
LFRDLPFDLIAIDAPLQKRMWQTETRSLKAPEF